MSASARSQKQQKEASRRAAPDARERIYRRRRLGPIISTVYLEPPPPKPELFAQSFNLS